MKVVNKNLYYYKKEFLRFFKYFSSLTRHESLITYIILCYKNIYFYFCYKTYIGLNICFVEY